MFFVIAIYFILYLQKGGNKLSDLKESFSLGPSNPMSGMPPRIFPSNPGETKRGNFNFTFFYIEN